MKAKSIIGKNYKLANGTKFKVLNIEAYPEADVSKRYKQILDFKPGKIVAVAHRGTLIPNITLVDGIVRLTKVIVNNEIFDRPKAISQAIGVEEAMHPYEIKEIS